MAEVLPEEKHHYHHLHRTNSMSLPDDEINELEIHAEEHKYNPYDIFHLQGKATTPNLFKAMLLTTSIILLLL
jgi:hypothetical protein